VVEFLLELVKLTAMKKFKKVMLLAHLLFIFKEIISIIQLKCQAHLKQNHKL